MIPRLRTALLVVVTFLAYLQLALCSSGGGGDQWIQYENPQGETVYLRNDRRPSLYTGNYGDCLGNSLINVTRFDAAFYKDNMTVLFHLAGNTQLNNESLVMYIGVFAYGSSRFDLIFNPCRANIESLCPLNSSVPIVASGIVPVGDEDVADIPSLAFSIPNFEGQAILRVFANSTESEIGCYSAVVTNGHSFAQPKSVGTILGLFALVSVVASFATAVYGEAIPTMRLHYAHSLSVGVVFAVYQHIYFTGALSMNWPAVLVAWWHNFAWSGGMIYSKTMQNSIDRLVGANIGNTSDVGAASSDSYNNNVGGGYQISQIYKRMFPSTFPLSANHPLLRDLASEIFRDPLADEIRRRELLGIDAAEVRVKRAQQPSDGLADRQDGYDWYGHALGPNMPLPGNYSGFAGTLAQENIAVSNAFMTGFLWFLVLLACLILAMAAFKGAVELLVRYKRIEPDRLQIFRDRWMRYTAHVLLRACYIAFFLLTFLAVFQFTFSSSGGVKAVAAIVFVVFTVGLAAIAAYAVYYKNHVIEKGPSTQWERKKLLGIIPWATPKKAGSESNQDETTVSTEGDETKTSSWAQPEKNDDAHTSPAAIDNIHDNEEYTKQFGWLASRFRRSRWWFFAAWLFYEFVRAVFYGGASGHPLVQVFGILVVEFIAFVFVVWAQPFEGRRLNILVVYCLGFSKVASVALSAAFDVTFNLPRITTTVIGIVVIVIQGILTIITMIAIVVGAISSYMSISRNREQFRPRNWHGIREKYFDHLDRTVDDLPSEPKPKKERKRKSEKKSRESAEPTEVVPGFEVRGMKRLAKIEDEDEEYSSEMRTQQHPSTTRLSMDGTAASQDPAAHAMSGGQGVGTETPDARSRAGSRAGSLRSLSQSNLPYGARQSRPSWSAKDFKDLNLPSTDEMPQRPTSMEIAPADTAVPSSSQKRKSGHSRASSLRSLKKAGEPTIDPSVSTESLRIGGEVSTKDTIGNVPVPSVRPRSNSARSIQSVGYHSGEDSGDAESSAGYLRTSRYVPAMMTPAQETDEWLTSAPKNEQL